MIAKSFPSAASYATSALHITSIILRNKEEYNSDCFPRAPGRFNRFCFFTHVVCRLGTLSLSRPNTSWRLSPSFGLAAASHLGSLSNFPTLRYENGIVYEWAVRKDNPLDLATVRATLREKTQSVILYELFFKLPQCELDVGLKIIENDRDLDVLYEYAHDQGIIQVYITHGPQDLSSYYVENMCLYGSEDDVNSRRKSVPKDAGNMSVQELVSWAEDEAALGSLAEEETVMGSIAIDDDICVTGVVDKGKGLAEKGKGLVDKGKGIMEYEGKAGRNTARTRNSGIVIGENVNPTFSEDDDTDSERDMEQRFKATVDLEEVFKVAGCSIPTRIYDMGETPTVIEHEEYMDTLMHQLRGKGDGLSDTFTILDSDQIKEKFPTHDDQTHWKMRKPKVGEKISKYSLIARCGRRLEKLKDIEKGKQKKQIKYPTLGANKGSNCPFRCYGRMMHTESSFQVISLNKEHTCVRDFKPRKQRIRAPHERQFPNRVSRAGVEMTCKNCFEKGHNKSSCINPTVIPPTKQPAKSGRPKKNVVTVEDGGDYTFDIGSAGVEAETNMGARGAEGEPNIGLMVVEDGIPGDTTVTSANLGEFVSVRCEGATSVTTARGRVGVKRGKGGTTICLGVRMEISKGTLAVRTWRGGVRRGTSGSMSTARGRGRGREPNEQLTPATQQSQVGIQQTAEDGRHDQASQNLRPRSERIMKKRLSSSINGSGSSNTNPHVE
ncbi:hypothetical protein Tco_1533992 [Tanacetum coccineum]